MTIKFEQVQTALEAEEPDYKKIANELGTPALPYLERIIVSSNSMLASKATYLAGMIGGEQSIPVIERAARNANVRVRIAAAATTRNLPPEAASVILLTMIDDADIGVRKTALTSVPDKASLGLMARVEAISRSRTDNALRDLARKVVGRLSR